MLKDLLGPWRLKFTKIWLNIKKELSIDKLNEIVDKYHNIYHKTIKMKSIDDTKSTYIDFHVESNDKDPTFKIGYHERMSTSKRARLIKRSFWY